MSFSQTKPVALISGCSTGFGRDLALAFLKNDFNVIATARRLQALDALKAQGAHTLALDVTDPPEALRNFAEQAIAIHGKIDVLVNNAGYLLGGAIEENSHEAIFAQFNTNFFGLINLTNAFLPSMRARQMGTIVNVSSQGGSLNFPGCGIYCATKAAVDSISETWASELEAFNIRCIAIQLGSFRTEVATSNNIKSPENPIDGYTKAQEWLKGFQANAGKEVGNTQVAAQRVVDLVQKAGPLPAWLPLGDDAVDNVSGALERRLKSLKEWREAGTGTSF